MSVEDFTSRSYDYVICGGGTAGLVVAARLTEDPEVTVAVLEAGKNGLGDILIDCPGMFPQLSGNPEYDWRYKTVPQGTHDRAHGWVRGKALGGSSAINWQMFSHASKQDLDNWAELGCDGWSYASLAPYYRKFETYYPCSDALGGQLNDKYIDKSLRGTSGPIKICFPETDLTWVQDLWPKTVKAAGYKPSMDPRTGSAIGGFNQLNTIDPVHKRRSYAAREYYEPNSNRPNLSVLTKALVSKIELETGGSDAKATGVSFIVDGSHYTVKAKKEVIVCGGVIGSPQILELSGIGSPEVLKKAGIDVKVDLPKCWRTSGLVVGVKDEFPTAETLVRNPDIMQQAVDAYTKHKAGPFVGAPTGTGFGSLEKIQPNFTDAEQHIQSIITDFEKKHPNRDLAGRDALLARQLLDPKEAVCQFVVAPTGVNLEEPPERMFPCSEEGNWMIMGVCSTRSLSRGSVHVCSADPNVHPMINPAYYSHPLDLEMMARALLHSVSFLEIEPLKSVVRRDEKGVPILNKDARGILPKTLEEAKEHLRATTVTEYHPMGTNPMLPREKGGVVDPASMKVYGTNNVRVIDASIFPLQVQGNIVSLVYAVAEKGADIIKGKVTTAN